MKRAPRTQNVVRGFIVLAVIWVCGFGQALLGKNPGHASQTAQKEPLVLTYVANAGVLVSGGETKVLIDGLFDKPNPDYRAPASEILEKMMKGTAPFDGVDLVLVTHNHPDHFGAGVAVRFLETLPEPLLMAPVDAVAEMRKTAADWKKIEPRVIPLDIKVGEKDKRDLKRIPVTAFRTRHSGDLESPINLMYLLELNGWSILHEGDSTGKPADFQGFDLSDAPLDLALVHFWFPLEPNCARFLQDVLKPDHIALTHLPIRLEGDAPGKIDQVREYYKDIFLLLPGMPPKAFRKQVSDEPVSALAEDAQTVTGRFFGQAPPGLEPVTFWPEILTAEKHPHGQLAFSPEGKDELLPLSETEFISDAEVKYFTFLKEGSDEAGAVIYKSGPGELKATRKPEMK